MEYPGAGFRFFAVEIDRNTETIQSLNLRQNAFGRKIAGYVTILEHRLHREHWGIPNLTVLTVTTNGTHARNLSDYVRKHAGARADRFAFASDGSFGVNWRIPRGVLSHLVNAPWLTPTGMKEISRA